MKSECFEMTNRNFSRHTFASFAYAGRRKDFSRDGEHSPEEQVILIQSAFSRSFSLEIMKVTISETDFRASHMMASSSTGSSSASN